MTAERAAREVLETIAALCRVLDEEAGHAKAMRLLSLRELQEPKARLGEALLAAQEKLGGLLDKPGVLPAPLGARLREATGRLKDQANANGRALRAAREINERMLRMLAEAASTAGRAPAHYGRGSARCVHTAGRFAVPLAIDRRA